MSNDQRGATHEEARIVGGRSVLQLGLTCADCLRGFSCQDSAEHEAVYVDLYEPLERGEYNHGIICRLCARKRTEQWMQGEDKVVLYLSRRLMLPSLALQVVAARLGRHAAERIRFAQIKVDNMRRLARWRREYAHLHCTYSPGKPSLAVPCYEWFVTDGFELFEIKCHVRGHNNGGHNWWCCSRRDVWFTDFVGNKWWGIHLAQEAGGGEWFSNDVVRCRKLKKQVA